MVFLLQHVLVKYLILLADSYFLLSPWKETCSKFLAHAPDHLTFTDCDFTYVAES